MNQSNTRHSNRIYVRVPIGIAIEWGAAISSCEAATSDFSPLGARVETKIALVQGTRVNIVWSGSRSRSFPSEVIWSAEVRGGQGHEAGLKFLEPLAADD